MIFLGQPEDRYYRIKFEGGITNSREVRNDFAVNEHFSKSFHRNQYRRYKDETVHQNLSTDLKIT